MARMEFHYEVLEKGALRAEVQSQAKQIASMLGTTGQSIIAIGQTLRRMRKKMTKPIFREWLHCEFRWELPTAEKYIRAAIVFNERQHVDRFQPSAIIWLSRKNVPARLVEQAMEAAATGELITQSWLVDRLKRWRVERDPRLVAAAEVHVL